MNEKQVILDFLEWHFGVPLDEITHELLADQYLESKQTKEEDNVDWFLHTHWTENTNIA